MENDLGMNQPGLLLAQFFRGEAISLQVTRAPIREEDVGILQQEIEPGAIFLRTVKNRGTHPNLYVPDKRLNLCIIRPPDVEDVGAVVGEVSADAGSGNHVPHSERANALQWA